MPRRRATPRSRPRPQTTRTEPARAAPRAVRRPDGRLGRGQVHGAGGARAPGRGDDLDRRDRPRAIRRRRGARRRDRPVGARSRAQGRRRPIGDRAPRVRLGRGARVARGPAVAARRPAGRGVAACGGVARAAAARGGGRDAAALRGRSGSRLRCHDRGHRRGGGARRARRGARSPRGRRAVRQATQPGGEGGARDVRGHQQRDRGGARGRAVRGPRQAGSEVSTHSHPATRRSRAPARRAAARRRTILRRRLTALGAAALLAALAAALLWPQVHHAVREITLPLRHEDIIRQQAREKNLNPALIAAVIYAESRFRDGQTSRAGAQGLMQITPATAQMIARKSGGVSFTVRDLGTPQVNIAYGSWYLRYLMQRYAGSQTFALAAYNGGEGNVDRWIDRARRRNEDLTIDAIPFSETRSYVQKVLAA